MKTAMIIVGSMSLVFIVVACYAACVVSSRDDDWWGRD